MTPSKFNPPPFTDDWAYNAVTILSVLAILAILAVCVWLVVKFFTAADSKWRKLEPVLIEAAHTFRDTYREAIAISQQPVTHGHRAKGFDETPTALDYPEIEDDDEEGIEDDDFI